MKNIGEFFRDLFVSRQWTIIKSFNLQEGEYNKGHIFVLQDQYGNVKKKRINFY